MPDLTPFEALVQALENFFDEESPIAEAWAQAIDGELHDLGFEIVKTHET